VRRLLVSTALAAAAAVVLANLRTDAPVEAVAPSQIIAEYKLKIRGEGFLRGNQTPYSYQRLAGTAYLTFSSASGDPDDKRLRVEIRLDDTLQGGMVDLATPFEAFLGEGYLVGDSMTVIDTGGPTYVNVLALQFIKDGKALTGHWISSYPASSPDSGAASGIGLTFTGKRRGKPPASRPRR
jgi:hypothetical protein